MPTSEHKSQTVRALAKELQEIADRFSKWTTADAAFDDLHKFITKLESLDALEQPITAEEVEALKREIGDLKAFIRGISINCQRAGADLAQVAASAKAATKEQQS